MESGVSRATAFVMCLTAAYVRDSPNCMYEYRTAVGKRKPIVVVALDDFPDADDVEARAPGADWDAQRRAAWDELQAKWSAAQRATLAHMLRRTVVRAAPDDFVNGTWTTTFSERLRAAIERDWPVASTTAWPRPSALPPLISETDDGAIASYLERERRADARIADLERRLAAALERRQAPRKKRTIKCCGAL